MALKTCKEILDEISELRINAQSVLEVAESEDRELTGDEQSSFDEFVDKADSLESTELPRAEKRAELTAKAKQAAKLQNRIDSGDVQFGQNDGEFPKNFKVPVRARAARKLEVYENERDAYVAGNVILANIFGNEKATRFCNDMGLSPRNAQLEGQDPKGGFLVPEEMQRTLIRLREERGVFPRYARNYPMASDSVFVPRDINDQTAYWVGENVAITESDVDMGGAKIVAEKLACLTKVSSELDEDSVVDIGEMVTRSMAYAMADKIDEAGFNGDGTNTYGGVVGLKNALNASAVNDAASGNVSGATMDLTDFETTVGLLAQYPGIRPVWFMHSQYFWASAARLMDAAGGNRVQDLGSGPVMQFLGYPVVFTQVLPSAPSTSTISAYFGDLSLAATIGSRRNVRTQISVDRYFENDMIGIKCTQRVGITVHERGDTIRTRPVVALKHAAS